MNNGLRSTTVVGVGVWKKLLPVVMLATLLLSGCTWFSAKTLSPEQLDGMAKIMEIQKAQGCFRLGVEGSFWTAEAGSQAAMCWGLAAPGTLEDFNNMMGGVVFTRGKP